MMGDNRPSEHSTPMEFLNICLGDNLLTPPGASCREACDLSRPCGEKTWASGPPDCTRQDAPLGASSAEPAPLGSGSSQGVPRQSQSSSTQVAFWAGILQAQMCVLDLEEELEKTEGLRAQLRCCLPTAPANLTTFPFSPAGLEDSGLHPSAPEGEASGEDSSGPEGESQNPVWPRKGMPDSSPEWGAEEESVFFDNPLFLESPCSDTGSSGAHFCWGFPDSLADVRPGAQSPQVLEPPVLGGRVPWELGSELDLGDSTAGSSGHTTPPFPMPIYKPHLLSAAQVDAPKGPPAVLSGWGEHQTGVPAWGTVALPATAGSRDVVAAGPRGPQKEARDPILGAAVCSLQDGRASAAPGAVTLPVTLPLVQQEAGPSGLTMEGGREEDQGARDEKSTPREDSLDSAPPLASCVDEALTLETGHVPSDPSPASQPAQPWALPSLEVWQMEEGPSWPQVPLISQDRGDRDAEWPQESAPCTLAPGFWGSPASSPEPSSPESESRVPGPRPSPASSLEGSPKLQGRHSGNIFPKWTLGAFPPSLLETDGAEPSSLEKQETGEAPIPAEEVKNEGPARPSEHGAAWPDADLTSTEGLPECPMPHSQSPEEGQRPQAGDKLANGVRTAQVAWNLATRLYHLEGFRKSEVAAYLQKNNDFSRAVAEEYLSFFQFGGQSLDRALRGFLQALVLSGETQERERVLYQFSKRFQDCNPGVFPSVDSVHTLTCAIMLLNTDLHGQNIGKSMSCQEFVTNLNGLRDGGNFPKELLKALYWSIRSEKLEWAIDDEDAAGPEKAQLSPPAGKIVNPFLQLAQDPTVPTYKQGILARKMHQDADGKKTPWGKRGWKMFHTLLRGMVLYFLKGQDHCPEGQSLLGLMVDEPVGVHHSLATPATHYTKKPHVFQLRTADWRLYLFQAPTAKDMSSWVSRINLAAATHSAPPFPAAVGSQRRFVRPILPAGPARSSLEEQHRSHENCLDAAADGLLDLQRNLPGRRGRSRELEEYRLRKDYLEYEKMRYETYMQLLVARLHCPSDDLGLWEEQLSREAGGTQELKPSLKKSHSSPTLHQDEAPTTAKVKRNISERRTYRKIIPKRNRNQL